MTDQIADDAELLCLTSIKLFQIHSLNPIAAGFGIPGDSMACIQAANSLRAFVQNIRRDQARRREAEARRCRAKRFRVKARRQVLKETTP